MTFSIGHVTRLLFAIIAFTVSATALTAQSESNLPPYVIEEFGLPPTVPEGPLSDELRQALKATFVDSVASSSWGEDQNAGLMQVAQSGDPRLVWIISDMMRFVSSPRLNGMFADAASDLLAAVTSFDPRIGSLVWESAP